MSSVDHPAGENIAYLDQGIELLRRLTDAEFAGDAGRPQRRGVGAQFRHCLDFYSCFLDGIAEGRIDYARRQREMRLETDRGYAIEHCERLRAALLALDETATGRTVEVRAEVPEANPAAPEWSASSATRELQFLISHTVHHYALIALLLQIAGREPAREFPEFGVAPSTLKHWKATGALSS